MSEYKFGMPVSSGSLAVLLAVSLSEYLKGDCFCQA
jgi:hypothetical protein